MLYEFCTLFDRNYASRGLALYRSLQRVCPRRFRLTILCIDVETRDALAGLTLPGVRLWLVEDLGDADLLEIRKTRPRREFCWTCPGPLMLALLREAAPGEIVTYLDADLFFFSDPAPVYEEMGGADIYIHGHNFSPSRKHYETTAGIFNVGLVAVRKTSEGIACLTRWRGQCLEVCELNEEKGHCGDQKYLDEWPSLYRNLAIAQHPGVSLAPWNIDSHDVAGQPRHVTVDGQNLIFYHFHALRILSAGRWSWVVQPAFGYDFTLLQRRLIYRPYAAALRHARNSLRRTGLDIVLPVMPEEEQIRRTQDCPDLMFLRMMGPFVFG